MRNTVTDNASATKLGGTVGERQPRTRAIVRASWIVAAAALLTGCIAVESDADPGSSAPTPSPTAAAEIDGTLYFTRTTDGDVQSVHQLRDGAERTVADAGETCCVVRAAPSDDVLLVLPGQLAPPITGAKLDPQSGQLKLLPSVDATLNLVPSAWSPDGQLIAYEGWDESDPARTGIYFFAAKLSLALAEGWSGIEDSTGELKLVPPGGGAYGMSFWLDHFLVDDGEKVSGLTAQDWIDWHVIHPQLVTTEPTEAMLGDFPATRIDVRLSGDPANSVAECPGGQCADLWGYEHFDHYNGIAGDDVYRLFVADVQYGGSTHLFGLIVEAQDAQDLELRMKLIEPALQTLTVIASPG